MDALLQKLAVYGADIDGVKDRFMGNTDMFLMFVKKFAAGDEVIKLGDAIKREAFQDAFEIAHSLKGVSGNLGLTPLFNAICDVVEPLRVKEYDGIDEKFTVVQTYWNELLALL